MTAWNSKRSCPAPADASAARRAGMSALRMWSTLTSTLFLLPQSAAYLSIHSSYAGTKWLQTSTLSVAPALAAGSGPAGAAAAAGFAAGDGSAPAAGEAPAAGDAAGAAAAG